MHESYRFKVVVPHVCGMYERIDERQINAAERKYLRPIHKSVVRQSLVRFKANPWGTGERDCWAQLCTFGNSWRFWVLIGVCAENA